MLPQPPATSAAATSAAPAASTWPSGSSAAATSAALVAAGNSILQTASHCHTPQEPQPTGQMLLPPIWVPSVPLSSSTAAENEELASRRYPGEHWPSHGVSKPGQQGPVGVSLKGECLAAGAVLLGCGPFYHWHVPDKADMRMISALKVVWLENCGSRRAKGKLLRYGKVLGCSYVFS